MKDLFLPDEGRVSTEKTAELSGHYLSADSSN